MKNLKCPFLVLTTEQSTDHAMNVWTDIRALECTLFSSVSEQRAKLDSASCT